MGQYSVQHYRFGFFSRKARCIVLNTIELPHDARSQHPGEQTHVSFAPSQWCLCAWTLSGQTARRAQPPLALGFSLCAPSSLLEEGIHHTENVPLWNLCVSPNHFPSLSSNITASAQTIEPVLPLVSAMAPRASLRLSRGCISHEVVGRVACERVSHIHRCLVCSRCC